MGTRVFIPFYCSGPIGPKMDFGFLKKEEEEKSSIEI